MALAFSTQGAIPTPMQPPNYAGMMGAISAKGNALNSAQQPTWQSTMQNVQGAYNKNPIQAPITPVNTGQNNQSSIHQGLLDTLKTQGGSHTTTDTAGNTQTTKVNPLDVSQNPTGSANTTNATTGQTTGVFPPGSPQNAGGGAKPQLTPSVTLPNGTQGYTDEQGNLFDAQGNPMPAQNVNYQAPTNATFPGLIQQAQTSALGNTAIGQNAADIAAKAGKAYTEVGQAAGQGEAGYLSGMGTNPVAVGNAGIVAQNAAAQQSAIAAGAQQALTGTAQQLTGQNQQTTGLLGAAGAATPTQVPYSNQFINPQTGQPVSNTGTTGNAANDVQNLATAVANGTSGLTYQQAFSQLAGYGVAVQNQLLPAIQKINPNFNVVQSNVNAQTQGQLQPAAVNAQLMLQNLTTTLNSDQTPGLVKTAIPFINNLSTYLSQMFGPGAGGTQAVQSALTDARAAMANALGAANNATPSTYDAYVKTLLPDGITPDQLTNAISQFNTQIQGKISAYGNPGGTQYNNQTLPKVKRFQLVVQIMFIPMVSG